MARALRCEFCGRWLESYAAGLKTNRERERLSNALLSLNQGWRDGAHPEAADYDSRRSRRIRAEHTAQTLGELMREAEQNEVLDLVMLETAGRVLVPRQAQAWQYCVVLGMRQVEAAAVMGITQQRVSAMLESARRNIGRNRDLELEVKRLAHMIFDRYDQSNWPRPLKWLSRAFGRG